MATRALTSATVPKTYAELKRGVEETLLAGQQRIERARLETYWLTGRLVHDHLELHADEAGYGTQTIRRLTRDLGLEESLLYRCLRFARAYPIFAGRQKLGWSHYRVLSFVKDDRTRHDLEVQALKQQWTADHLDRQIRALTAGDAEPRNLQATGLNGQAPFSGARLLVAKRGTPGLHGIIDRGADGLAVDLGFKLYRALEPEQQKRLEKGAIVRLGEERITRADGATKADLFTYDATIRRVVDADTLIIGIEVAPGIWLEEKLRLRGLDAPELSTAEGKAAKRFVDHLLPAGTAVVVSTTKPDKYDRYLADVFIGATSGGEAGATMEAVFLNNALLEHGHAVRKDAWEFRDWEKDLPG